MANAYSLVRRQRPYIPALNVADIERTLAVKQQNYDYNTAQVNQAIAQFGSIDLIRQEDREYLYNNLKSVMGIVKNSDNIDFSKSGVGSELTGFISKAIDGNVLKQAQNTMAIRKFDTGITELKEENPELYSSVNERDARYMAGYYKYMNGESDKLGSLNYVPFQDVQGKMIDTIKTLKDIYPDQEVEVPLGNGYMQKKKVSQLNSYEWSQLLKNTLTNADRAQLAIDGRNALGYSNEAAMQQLQGFKDQTSEQYDSLIELKKAEKLTSTDDASINSLNEEITNLEKAKAATLAQFDKVGKTAGEIGGYFIEQQMINGFVGGLSREFNLGFTKDDAYFANLKAMNEKAKSSGAIGDANQDGAPDIYTQQLPVDTPDGVGNLVDNFERDYDNETQSLRSNLATAYSNLSQEYKDEVDALEQSIIDAYTRETGEAPSEFALHRMVVEKAKNILPSDTRVELLRQIDRVDQYGKAKQNAIESASNALFIENAEDIYEELKDNPKIKMYGLNSGTTTFNDFLKNKGIRSTQQLISFLGSNSEDAKVFKANFLVQTADDVVKVADTLDGTNVTRSMLLGSLLGRTGTPVGLGSSMNISDTTRNRIKRAAQLLGEDVEDMFNPDSKLGQMIKQVKEEVGGRGGNLRRNMTGAVFAGIPYIFDPDTTLSQDNIANKFDGDEFGKKYEEALNLASAQIPGKNMIIVAGKNGKFDVPLHAEIRTKASSTALIKPNVPLQLIRDSEGNLIVTQLDETKSSKDGLKSFQRVGLINKNDITPENMPNLYNYLDYEKEQGDVDYLSEMRTEMTDLTYSDDNARAAAGLNNLFPVSTNQGRKVMQMASKNGVVPFLQKDPLLRNMKSAQRGNEYFSIVNNAIKNSNKFSVKLDSYQGNNKIAVTMKGRDGREIVLRRLDVGQNINNREFVNMYYGAPQVFLTLALQQMGANYLMTNDFSDLETIKNNL